MPYLSNYLIRVFPQFFLFLRFLCNSYISGIHFLSIFCVIFAIITEFITCAILIFSILLMSFFYQSSVLILQVELNSLLVPKLPWTFEFITGSCIVCLLYLLICLLFLIPILFLRFGVFIWRQLRHCCCSLMMRKYYGLIQWPKRL